MEVAKLGVQVLHLWDFDTVEDHNLANQLFGLQDVGKTKVRALGERILADTGLRAVLHEEAVTAETSLQGVVFLLTDTMRSRKEIWEGAIKLRPWVDLMIETRMGKDEGRIYAVRPTSSDEIAFWEKKLWTDEESSESLCGARTTVGATAALIQAHAVWTMLRWWEWFDRGSDCAPAVETMVFLNPPMVHTYSPRSALPR